ISYCSAGCGLGETRFLATLPKKRRPLYPKAPPFSAIPFVGHYPQPTIAVDRTLQSSMLLTDPWQFNL
ncbi:MAG: hypothetical protein ABW176_11945, partial [Candidatus Thiodiazotropha endolucinida]